MTDPNVSDQAAGGRGEEAVQPDSGRGPEDESAPLAIVRLLLLAVVLGLVAAFAAVLCEIVLHVVQNLLWSNLPDVAGWQEPPWWYVLTVPALGGLIVALALRLAWSRWAPPTPGPRYRPYDAPPAPERATRRRRHAGLRDRTRS